MQVRRVVTGHDADGRSVVVSDEGVEPTTVSLMPGMEIHRVWGADETLTLPDDGAQPAFHEYFPPVDGFRFVTYTLPPDNTPRPTDIDPVAAVAELDERLPGMTAHMELDNPGMHTTDSVDVVIVLEGEICLELDDGNEVSLRPGDTLVQNGTRHTWHNRGNVPARIAVTLIGANRKS